MQSIITVVLSSVTGPTLALDTPCFLNVNDLPFITAIMSPSFSCIESHPIVDALAPLPVSSLASNSNSVSPIVIFMFSLCVSYTYLP